MRGTKLQETISKLDEYIKQYAVLLCIWNLQAPIKDGRIGVRRIF